MRWGRSKTQVSPDKSPERPKEKRFSLIACLLSKLLCIPKPCSYKESNEKSQNTQYVKPDMNSETSLNSAPNSEVTPDPKAPSIKHKLDITTRPKIGYKSLNRHGPAVIYGLDPTIQVQSRQGKVAKVATKFDEKDLEEFAVAKKSSNPESDFKESMIRMIRLKRISRPEDLENLLACYLVLNADEYHDAIVKVFRQVWIEISSARLRSSRRPLRANRRG